MRGYRISDSKHLLLPFLALPLLALPYTFVLPSPVSRLPSLLSRPLLPSQVGRLLVWWAVSEPHLYPLHWTSSFISYSLEGRWEGVAGRLRDVLGKALQVRRGEEERMRSGEDEGTMGGGK